MKSIILNLIAVAAASLLLAAACSQEAAESSQQSSTSNQADLTSISYEKDTCAFTGDTITVVRYGGEIEMQDGTVHKFMSVECVAGFYLGLEDKSKVKSLKIVDFAHGKKLLPPDELVYLNSSLRPSPNGMFLTAVDASNERMKTYIYDAYPGPYLQWDEVLAMVSEKWNL